MRKITVIFLIIISFSYKKEDWKDNITEQLNQYNSNEILIKVDTFKNNLLSKVIVKRYQSIKDYSKILIEYQKSSQTGKWTKTYFIKKDSLKYAFIEGTSSLKDNLNEKIYIEQEIWFKDTFGYKETKELIFNNISPIDSIKIKAKKMKLKADLLYEKDYDFVFNEIMFFKDKN